MWCREARVVLPEEEDGETCGEGEERGEDLGHSCWFSWLVGLLNELNIGFVVCWWC